MEDIGRLKLEVVHKEVMDPKFVEWKNGTHNREAMELNRSMLVFSVPIITLSNRKYFSSFF